ncbi:MAG: EAL domain-containing protein [Treponema sp.]|nr:EAL domain-containing protein [Treponema sp.]
MILLNRKSMAKRVFAVFAIYPLICLGLVFIQFFEPKVIMTGTAAFAALFFAYITIQSDMIDYDVVTGLMTENKLRKQISLKNSYGYVYMLSIENINQLQASMSVSQMNELFLNLGKQLSKCFERSSFRISSNRLAGICKDEESLKKNARIMAEYISSLNVSMDGILPASLEVYSAAIQFSKEEVVYDNVIEILNNMIYKSKAKGLRQLQICDDAILVDMDRKRYIYKILKKELRLDSDQFQVWFQPIYSLKEKRFTYMEALSRLNNTDIGDIPPGEFVQIAEAKGLIEKLGNVAFEKVCKFISENKNLVNAVSINFSVYQMTNPNLVQNVLGTIGRFGLKPTNIIMEITESIFIENFDLVRKNMIQLAEAGIKFYLDDFGTGYSNLANVIGLEFSTIKIDRSLVLMMEENKKAENLISNLIGTFKDAELEILVEGVETNNQNDLVLEAGADYIQGFLYSRPLPPEECIELLKNQEKKGGIHLEED